MDLAIIPIKNDKKSYVKWAEYQVTAPTEAVVREWWTRWPNASIGIITGALNDLTVIDIDTDDANQKIEELLPSNLLTPMATTPRGGKHIYFNYHKDVPNKSAIIPGCDVRSQGGYIIAPPSQNGNGKVYKWIKAYKITSTETVDLPEKLVERIKEGAKTSLWSQKATRATGSHKIMEGQRDNELFHVGYALAKGFMPIEEIEQYLQLIGSYCCEPPFESSEIKEKAESILKRINEQNRNVSFLVREWVSATSGHFLATECYTGLQLATREEKRAGNAELYRLCQEGKIERYGDKKAMYRTITQFVDFEDFKNVDDTPLDIRLPFGFEKYVEIYPGDLISFNGVRNSGKTAIALEFIRLNMRRHKVFYFSREIKKRGLRRRLAKHDNIPVNDWDFKFASNIANFTDILQPDAINIIDYIEVMEGEYFKIPSILADIHQHLVGDAIAVVMLQKRTEKKWGVGGEGVEEKPVLVFNIDPNFPEGAIITANKVKNKIHDDYDVEGYRMKFKLRGGINFIPLGVWGPDYE
ncbi:hypothetical protein LCGC14_1482260 [marine sediment metagenome]|uniref:DNA primase/polymerase bifunctional N-terminal domain-containing protein n=1 Tax=marine sediment metagenome TaxID=412755 RepID=A0A0F9JV69_9ZZZZ